MRSRRHVSIEGRVQDGGAARGHGEVKRSFEESRFGVRSCVMYNAIKAEYRFSTSPLSNILTGLN